MASNCGCVQKGQIWGMHLVLFAFNNLNIIDSFQGSSGEGWFILIFLLSIWWRQISIHFTRGSKISYEIFKRNVWKVLQTLFSAQRKHIYCSNSSGKVQVFSFWWYLFLTFTPYKTNWSLDKGVLRCVKIKWDDFGKIQRNLFVPNS